MATLAKLKSEPMPGFSLVALFVMTAHWVPSLPVPAVVVIAITGRVFEVIAAWSGPMQKSQIGRPWPSAMAMPLAASIAEPPPRPMNMSQPFFLAKAAPASISVFRGLGDISP